MPFLLKFTLAFLFVLGTSSLNFAAAAQVVGVKGKQVLVRGKNLRPNGLYYIVIQGKRQGIVRVRKVQGTKAIALVLKGRASKGANLVYRPPQKTDTKPSKASAQRPAVKKARTQRQRPSNLPTPGFYGIGGAVAYHQNKSDIKFNVGDSDSLSGSGISFKAFGDYMFTERLHLRGEFGTVAFRAEGADKCFGEQCRMNINYLGATLGIRYMLNPQNSTVRYWGGAAASIIFPMNTGDTNAVEVDEVGSTMNFHFGGGLDYQINDKYFIPVTAEYIMFPPSEDVSSSMILMKLGFGMRL